MYCICMSWYLCVYSSISYSFMCKCKLKIPNI